MSERSRRRDPVSERDNKKLNKQSFQIAARIFKFISPYRAAFISGLICLFISTFVSLCMPFLMGKLIDTGVSLQSGQVMQTANNALSSLFNSSFFIKLFSNSNAVAILLVSLLLLQAGISFCRIYFFATVTEKAMADVRIKLYDKLVTLSIPFFEERRVGELTSRSTNDVDQLQDMLSMTLPEFVRQLLTISVSVIILFFISAKLTFLMLSTFPILVIVAVVYGKYIRKVSKQRQDALANSNVVVEETMQNINTVKAFGNELYESNRYKSFMRIVIETGIKGALNRGGFTTFLILGIFGGFVLVLWYGATLLQAGELTPGILTSYMLYTLFIGGSVGGLGDLYGRLQKTVGASERIFEILDAEGEFNLHQSEISSLRLDGKIQFQNVYFSYPTRKDIPVLKGISFSINQGEKIALAGHSGAGKSTIAQLIFNFYQTDSGEILLDGKSIKTYSVKDIRNNMAIVPQEVILFGGTIRENIAYGNPNASENEIILAAQKANAWNFISSFPQALDTVVGERGIKLSGGQRQRIAIARAILKNPSILILDEATSSLDAESEKAVQDALELLMQNRTTIIIAHRLSTIRNVDKIFVIDTGVISEQGTFSDLSNKEGGIFKRLLELQLTEKSQLDEAVIN